MTYSNYLIICAVSACLTISAHAQERPKSGTGLPAAPPAICAQYIELTKDGFLVATTHHGIIRHKYVDGLPQSDGAYTTDDGLPGNWCRWVRRDMQGGLWAFCLDEPNEDMDGPYYAYTLAEDLPYKAWSWPESPLVYLAPGAEWWQRITDDELKCGGIITMQLSAAKDRVWVLGPKGVATADVGDLKWETYPRKLLRSFIVSPEDSGVIWCEEARRQQCMCGWCAGAFVQFCRKNKTWTDFPPEQIHGLTPSIDPLLSSWHFDAKRRLVFIAQNCYYPPLVVDLEKKVATMWPEACAQWLQTPQDGEFSETEFRGGPLVSVNNTDRLWFATSDGLWEYRIDAERCTPHCYPDADRPHSVFLLWCDDREEEIFWASDDGDVAIYTIATDQWKTLQSRRRAERGLDGTTFAALAPDGESLWYGLRGRVSIINCKRRTWKYLEGLYGGGDTRRDSSDVTTVRFDEEHNLALIGTSTAIGCSSFNGENVRVLQGVRVQVASRKSGKGEADELTD